MVTFCTVYSNFKNQPNDNSPTLIFMCEATVYTCSSLLCNWLYIASCINLQVISVIVLTRCFNRLIFQTRQLFGCNFQYHFLFLLATLMILLYLVALFLNLHVSCFCICLALLFANQNKFVVVVIIFIDNLGLWCCSLN